VDLSVIKNVALPAGKFQFRFEAINAFNRAQFPAGINLGPTNAVFGQLVATAQQNYARRVQIMLKYMY
jgi:hypothetical protein